MVRLCTTCNAIAIDRICGIGQGSFAQCWPMLYMWQRHCMHCPVPCWLFVSSLLHGFDDACGLAALLLVVACLCTLCSSGQPCSFQGPLHAAARPCSSFLGPSLFWYISMIKCRILRSMLHDIMLPPVLQGAMFLIPFTTSIMLQV
eukprot:GHRR01001444.1.p1 GENE.GHRR01001444.1~~GHRR01001444.1.p1  ORF type:complete len:146 (+),score=20.43 GHRR01001444.1:2525-2962(+)